MKQFIIAWQFLTIIPINRNLEVTAESLGRSMASFPLVGLLLGLIVAVLDVLYSKLFPADVSSALLLASYIVMYGGFHLDGLVDTVDGLAGGKDREHALRIMKESTIGAIGVVVLILTLLVKYTAILSLPGELRAGSLIFMPVAGRWIEVFLVYRSKYAREGEGLGRPFTEYIGKKEMAIATVITIGVSWLTLHGQGLVIIGTAAVLGMGMRRFFHKRIGGITGDVLGAGGEICELIALLSVIALSNCSFG